MIDIWICNGFVVIYDSGARWRKEGKPAAHSEE
jgi:hypothetical protein